MGLLVVKGFVVEFSDILSSDKGVFGGFFFVLNICEVENLIVSDDFFSFINLVIVLLI